MAYDGPWAGAGERFIRSFSAGVEITRGFQETAELVRQRKLQEQAQQQLAQLAQRDAEFTKRAVHLKAKQQDMIDRQAAGDEIDETALNLTTSQLMRMSFERGNMYHQFGLELLKTGNPYSQQEGQKYIGMGLEIHSKLEQGTMELQRIKLQQEQADIAHEEAIAARRERRSAQEHRQTMETFAEREAADNRRYRSDALRQSGEAAEREFNVKRMNAAMDLYGLVKDGTISKEDAEMLAGELGLPFDAAKARTGAAGFLDPEVRQQYEFLQHKFDNTDDPRLRQQIQDEMDALVRESETSLSKALSDRAGKRNSDRRRRDMNAGERLLDSLNELADYPAQGARNIRDFLLALSKGRSKKGRRSITKDLGTAVKAAASGVSSVAQDVVGPRQPNAGIGTFESLIEAARKRKEEREAREASSEEDY